MKKLTVSIAAIVVMSFTVATAAASPWTLRQDDLSLTLGVDVATADTEYLQDGTEQAFPLEGEFNSTSFRLGTRYGFTDRFEGAAELSYKTVTFEALPILDPTADTTAFADRAEATGSIIDFSKSRSEPADIRLAGRYNFLKSLLMVTGELELKVPTGYEPPQGTIDAETGVVLDDVSVGDGQTDVSGAILLGLFVPQTRSFLRLDLGYRHRLSEPGDQVFERFKIGQFLGDHIILFAGINGDFTVMEGDPIGTTLQAVDPETPPEDYDDPAEDLRPEPLLLDRDNLSFDVGALFVFGNYELTFDYSQTLLGANQAAIQSFTVGAAVRLEGVTGR